ncbi:DUF4248 domain-containing protein [Aquimarina mytili]|uniref:DUF4248 domain-containing protein n=1 Tax=Aquimarina mytili TaxID=874423 RepID=A0A936ZV82_9FLAO|nr:DUF4248 domain-containing protein [Aquimarina mytili]MBL0685293.1 DUF4248 domain-containing protein [Aquimarina mytili]
MKETRLQPIYFEGEQPVKIKAYYKYELAALYNICTKTFSSWIHIYLEELEQFGYKKRTKLLRPEVVRFLFERLGEP